nr:reverse transcriptase domain-containing protein [Tanacetum cinerariifolium]
MRMSNYPLGMQQFAEDRKNLREKKKKEEHSCLLSHCFFIIAVQTPGSRISILLAVGTPSTGSGNSLLAVGMPCAFYSQQSSPKLDAPSVLNFFIIAVQTPGSGISIILAVGTSSTGSGNLYCQSSSKLFRDQTSNPNSYTNPTPKGRICRSSKQKVENSNFEENPLPPEVPMAENQTMAQLLQAPTDGYEDAIVISEIAATNFELKHGLINLVQNKQFFGHKKEDPHAHLRYSNKITSTMRV